ncbi:MAG: cation diffusion facilitator family transporter [Beijerinckiaceae bacterium]|nr:cation diffusion facilitator family transporter [Beijerinckiaceae bacterium]
MTGRNNHHSGHGHTHVHTSDKCGHHGHGHEHGGGHHHAPASFGRAFVIGIALNTGFVVVEFVFGLLSNSVALMADAGHNLGDVLGLLVAWTASVLVKRAPSARFTYGLRGSSIVAALFNAVFLLLTVGAISWEAVQRFSDPQPIAGKTVMIVAAIGIVINGITAWLFAAGSKDDINLRGAFLHMASDALVSAGVVIASLVILFTGWLWLDPVVSLAINLIIVVGTWGLLRDSLVMSMAAVPKSIDPDAVDAFLKRQTGIIDLHDLHIWPMSTTEVALTCHLVMPSGHPGDAFLKGLTVELRQRFAIHHPTFQIETDPDNGCPFAPAHVV